MITASCLLSRSTRMWRAIFSKQLLNAVALVLVLGGGRGLSVAANAAPYVHRGFTVQVPDTFQVRKDQETPTKGVVILPALMNLKLACTIVSSSLTGPAATPKTWVFPDHVLATPTILVPVPPGGTQKIRLAEKYIGASGFQSVRVVVERTAPGIPNLELSITIHTLLDPKTQGIMICSQGPVPINSITNVDIRSALSMGASLKKR